MSAKSTRDLAAAARLAGSVTVVRWDESGGYFRKLDAVRDELDIITCTDAGAWEAWLAAHHRLRRGVWLKIAKERTRVASVTNDEAVNVGLCWGWISGHRKALDDTCFLQRYTPRRPRSNWSAVNVAKVEALIADGRMQAPGLAEIDAVKADGRWERPARR